jgi:hypothetical protein
MSRAEEILSIISEMTPEEDSKHDLENADGYTYQDKGQKGLKKQMPDGKRPAGLDSKAGKSS